MTATKTYRPNNSGLSDAEYYGRQPALGVDLDAARRAATCEARHGYDWIIRGAPERGMLVVQRAVLRLSVALGNQSEAEEYLATQAIRPLSDERSAEAVRLLDAAELDRGAAREHAHPELAAALQAVEARLTALLAS